MSPGLIEAILDACRKSPYRIKQGTFGFCVHNRRFENTGGGTCCAIGAYVIGRPAVGNATGIAKAVAEALGLTANQVESFMDGFDGYLLAAMEPDYFAAGHIVRRTLCAEGVMQ